MSALRHSSKSINIGRCKPEPVNPGAVACSHDSTFPSTEQCQLGGHRLRKSEDRQEMNLQKSFLGSRGLCWKEGTAALICGRDTGAFKPRGDPSSIIAAAQCHWKCVVGSPGLAGASMVMGWWHIAGPATSSGGFAVLGHPLCIFFPALWRNWGTVLPWFHCNRPMAFWAQTAHLINCFRADSLVLSGKKLSVEQISFSSLTCLPTRLPELHDFLKKNQNLPPGVLLIAFLASKTWISASKNLIYKWGTVCLFTKSQKAELQQWLIPGSTEREQEGKNLHWEGEPGLEHWPHCLTSAGARGCGCMSQGAVYYKYIVCGVHTNQRTRELLNSGVQVVEVVKEV